MVGVVNPLSSVGGFQNQQLQRFVAPRAGAPSRPEMVNQVGLDAQAPDLDGFGKIKENATRQHDLYLAALKAQQERQRASQITARPSGGGRRFVGGGGALTGQHGLIPGASQALGAMNAAFRQQFGYDIPINEGGRSRERQQYLYDLYRAGKGNLAARPGTSLHESGRAVDLGGAFQNANSREHRWLQQNAGRWGYKWTGKNFSQFEPWHWEWMG